MPATTRRTRGVPAKGGQSTLSFNGSKSRVTKNTTPAGKDIKKPEPTNTFKPEVVNIEGEDVDVKVQEVQLERAKSEKKAAVNALTPEEQAAEKVLQSQVLNYWKAKESRRLAPRVHQEDLSMEEKILRLFDMSSQYGPCIGITRRKRWLRAHRLGLAPPIEALAVLVKEDKKRTKGIERAHIEELLASRIGNADES